MNCPKYHIPERGESPLCGDNDGGLAKVTDSETGITSTYYYDFVDRLCHYTEEADGYSLSMKYSFNKLDAVTFIEEKIDGSRRSTSITYDTDQRVTSIRKGSVTESYTYDGYSRVTEKITTLSGETRLTERYTYRTVNNAPTTQVASHQIITDVRDITYSYTYDSNGNILTVTETFTAPGALQATSTTTSYVYDSQNQLLRENNEAAGKTWTWTYDNAGNILSHGEYAYTTGELGTALDTVEYGYTAAVWGDLLCTYDGVGLGCDDLGNQTYIGDRRYVWKHGRELSQLIESGTTWTYTYNADGLRTQRTDGTTNYQYIYADGQLVKQKIGNSALNFSYDASGTPMSVTYNSANYYYVTNLQGDVIAITNDTGAAVVSYTYDAWGKILSITGSMADTLGAYNPLRYRGYVYDVETELYYLQSRYYNPEMGRFISPDDYFATGLGITGNNTFCYCLNNPIVYVDKTGTDPLAIIAGFVQSSVQVLLPVVAVVAVIGILTDPTVQNTVIQGCEQIALTVTNWVEEQKTIVTQKMTTSLEKVATRKPSAQYHIHHIVAQNDPRAIHSRQILSYLFECGVDDGRNLVSVSSRVHQRLHTNAYYLLVEHIIVGAFMSSKPDLESQTKSVEGALEWLRMFILSLEAL